MSFRLGSSFVSMGSNVDQPSKAFSAKETDFDGTICVQSLFDDMVLEPLNQRGCLQLFAFLYKLSRPIAFGVHSLSRCLLCFVSNSRARCC